MNKFLINKEIFMIKISYTLVNYTKTKFKIVTKPIRVSNLNKLRSSVQV